MPSIEIESAGTREFRVRVSDGGTATSHRVSVPERPEFEDLDLEGLVRLSFEFLLEREPASSILSEFALDDIARYFPEYWDELRRRLR